MTNVSNLSFEGNSASAFNKGNQIAKKKMIAMFRAELKKVGIKAEYLTEADVLRLHEALAIKEKIAISEIRNEGFWGGSKITEALRGYTLPRRNG